MEDYKVSGMQSFCSCVVFILLYPISPYPWQSEDDGLEKDRDEDILMNKGESWVADWSSRPENIPPKWVIV